MSNTSSKNAYALIHELPFSVFEFSSFSRKFLENRKRKNMPNGLSAALSALDRPLSDKEILDVIKITGQLNVWTCTWNMHAKTWPENLRKELKIASSKRVNHLYVMGTQECQRSIVSSAFLPSKWMWENALVKCFGERYVLVRSETMQALHVVVFVHRAILPFLKLVTTGSVPTGIRIKPTNVRLGNKGGVGIKFCLGKTNFAFVTCHLSAHQHRVQRRNQDFREINSLMNTKTKSDRAVSVVYVYVCI